jgi:hypothetical protein
MADKPLSKISAGIKKRGTEGVFSRAAKRAGMSTHAYAEEKEHSKGKLGKRARLALTFEAHRK